MTILNAAKITLLSLLIVSPFSSALAGDLSAVFNGKSYHVNASEDWNENNLGLGLEYELASDSRWKKQLMINGFLDSSEEMSFMAGAGLHRTLFASDRLNGFYVDAGLNAFVMTRKDINDNRPFPGALPSLSFGNRHVGVNLTYLPVKAVERLTNARMMDGTVSGIFFLQFKVAMDRLLPGH